MPDTTKPKAERSDDEKKAQRGKRKELAELRLRTKEAGERMKSASGDRSKLRTRTEALKKEMGIVSKRPERGGKGEKKA